MSHLAGVFLGRTLNAARDAAIPLADWDEMRDWATEQALLVSSQELSPELQIEFSSIVAILKGDPGDLIIGRANCGFMNSAQIEKWAQNKDTVFVWDTSGFALSKLRQSALNENVLVTEGGWPGVFQQTRPQGVGYSGDVFYYREHMLIEDEDSLEGRCAQAIFRGWGLPEAWAIAQLGMRTRVVQAYENETREHGDSYLSSLDDVNYPFREEVAKTAKGKSYITSITPLVRNTGDYGDIEQK